jgi:ATP synthase protein I
MTEPDESERLDALRRRIDALKGPPEAHHMESHYTQAQHAWRMVIELVAGLCLGAGIGYGLDWLLGSGPWLLIVFTLLGFAAGVKTVISSAEEIQKAHEARTARDATGPAPRDASKDGGR